VANGGTGILTAGTQAIADPELARRAWPQWLALGITMIAVAAAAVFWDGAGARLLLGAVGLFLAVRGTLLLRGARSGAMDATMARGARRLGGIALVTGLAGLAVAAASAELPAFVLLVAVPVLLCASAAVLLGRGGVARRGGQALLAWTFLLTGLLVATGVAQDWARAASLATVVAALTVAVLGVPLLIAAANLRTVAAAPSPAPARPAGCAGCACGAGGCGA
jgi:hypothetical protein